jgi:hypothetical protein
MPERAEPRFDELKALPGQQITDALRAEDAALNEHVASAKPKHDAPYNQGYLQGFLSGAIIGGIFGSASLCLYYRVIHGMSNEWEPTIFLILFISISLGIIINQLRSVK